jgi:hypothetical protein
MTLLTLLNARTLAAYTQAGFWGRLDAASELRPCRSQSAGSFGGSLYRTRRNVRSPSLKVHVAAVWNE